jgi:hypothetical protein
MNEFTKEELQAMENWGEVYTEFGNSWVDKIHRPLISKIQSLIDNYPKPVPENFIDILKYKTATRDLSELVNIDEFNKTMDAYKDE